MLFMIIMTGGVGGGAGGFNVTKKMFVWFPPTSLNMLLGALKVDICRAIMRGSAMVVRSSAMVVRGGMLRTSEFRVSQKIPHDKRNPS